MSPDAYALHISLKWSSSNFSELTTCACPARLCAALLSGLGGNWEFPDPWGKISAGSGLNCAKAEPGFKSEVFFQSSL